MARQCPSSINNNRPDPTLSLLKMGLDEYASEFRKEPKSNHSSTSRAYAPCHHLLAEDLGVAWRR